jgi:hypothetical protein
LPLAFPSHQGLIAPLWLRWPDHFNILALWVGAATPDVVDGATAPFRGGLGQWYGHSLVGMAVICLPLGMAITWLLRRASQAVTRKNANGRNWWTRLFNYLTWLDPEPAGQFNGRWWRREGVSVGVGAFSHLLIDFISHGNFLWFFPWYTNPRFFPNWWYIEWFRISVPGYRDPFPAGPYLTVWVVLGVLGIIMFIRSMPSRDPSAASSKGKTVNAPTVDI